MSNGVVAIDARDRNANTPQKRGGPKRKFILRKGKWIGSDPSGATHPNPYGGFMNPVDKIYYAPGCKGHDGANHVVEDDRDLALLYPEKFEPVHGVGTDRAPGETKQEFAQRLASLAQAAARDAQLDSSPEEVLKGMNVKELEALCVEEGIDPKPHGGRKDSMIKAVTAGRVKQ